MRQRDFHVFSKFVKLINWLIHFFYKYVLRTCHEQALFFDRGDWGGVSQAQISAWSNDSKFIFDI